MSFKDKRPCKTCGFVREVLVRDYTTFQSWSLECEACKSEHFANYHKDMAVRHETRARRLRAKQRPL